MLRHCVHVSYLRCAYLCHKTRSDMHTHLPDASVQATRMPPKSLPEAAIHAHVLDHQPMFKTTKVRQTCTHTSQVPASKPHECRTPRSLPEAALCMHPLGRWLIHPSRASTAVQGTWVPFPALRVCEGNLVQYGSINPLGRTRARVCATECESVSACVRFRKSHAHSQALMM